MRAALWACGMGAAAFLSGCFIVPVPERRDPFAGASLAARPPTYQNLRVGFVVSENSKKALRSLRQDSARLGAIDIDRIPERIGSLLRNLFKASVRLQAPEDAGAVGTDLLAVLDLAFRLPEERGEIKTDASLRLETLEREPVEVFRGEGRSAAAGPKDFPKALALSVEEAGGKLEKALLASQKLAQLDRSGLPRKAAPSPAQRHSEVDKPGYQLGENPGLFALVVGIGKYSALPEAEFAERDAEAVREHLIALGYPKGQIVFLTGSQAGRAGIEKYVESWLPSQVTEDSRVFMYFSGHGAPDPKTGLAYLVPWDGDAKFLENTGYPVKRLYSRLNALRAKEVILVLDACFSGAGGRSVLAKGTRPLVTQVDAGLGGGKLVVLAAAANDEITGTAQDQGHGLFTYYLLKGLGGEAKDPGGQVTLGSLFDYLLPQVRTAARRENRDQTPQLLPAPPGERAGLKLR